MENEIIILTLNLVYFHTTIGEIKGNIVGGSVSKIEDFPYTVFLSIQCLTQDKVYYFICGSAIVNQAILMTAAHCLEGCESGSTIIAYAGNANKFSGHVRSALRYIMHKKYDPFPITYDIALVRLNNDLQLGKHVRRVALSPKPPYFELATVAGWGVTDDTRKKPTQLMKHTNQKVWTHAKCLDLIPNLHRGAFCADGVRSQDHPAGGDSGSPLVVRKYIQIGLVSYSLPQVSKTLIVYTDVGYFFYWMRSNAALIYCNK